MAVGHTITTSLGATVTPTGDELGPITRPSPVDFIFTFTDGDMTPITDVQIQITASDFPSQLAPVVSANVITIYGSSDLVFPSLEGIKYVIGTEHFTRTDNDYTKVPKEGDPYEWKSNPSRGEVFSFTFLATSTIGGSLERTYTVTVLNNWDADRDRIRDLCNDDY